MGDWGESRCIVGAMDVNFSSAKAWRTLILVLKVELGTILIVTPIGVFINLRRGDAALPDSYWIAAAIILAITLLPWILWWLVLWLSERTLDR